MTGAAVADLPAKTYVEGQGWEYRARQEDKGSLLRIQKIDALPEFARIGPGSERREGSLPFR
jgi:hypothetical protein